MVGFSKESPRQIRQALAATPAGSTDFSVSLSEDNLAAHYCWAEGFEIHFDGEHYRCTHKMERSTRSYDIPDEAEAVRKFIRIACQAKQY